MSKQGNEDAGRTILVNVLLLIIGLGVAYGIYVGIEFAYSTDAPLRVVISGSMIPKYNINDVVVVHGVGPQVISVLVFNVPVDGVNASTIKNGTDIIFWYPDYSPSDPIVHEVVQVIPNSSACSGDTEYITHGIAPSNKGIYEHPCAALGDNLSYGYVIGYVTGSIPYVGYVSEFLKSWLGITLIIILIGILLVIEILEPKEEEEPEMKVPKNPPRGYRRVPR